MPRTIVSVKFQRHLVFVAVCASMMVTLCLGHDEEAAAAEKHVAEILSHHHLNENVHLHDHDHDHDLDHDHDHHNTNLPKPQQVEGAPMIGHRCIHDQIVMKNPPIVEQSYAAYPKWNKKRHTERGSNNNNNNAKMHHRMYEATSTDYNNMRFKFYFDVDNVGKCAQAGVFVNSYQNSNENVNCTANDVLTALKRDYILNSLMPQAVNFLNGALNVIPISGALVAPASCHGITTPSSHQTPGVSDADFVAYVTAVPLASTSSNGTVAWATACAYDGNGRPIAGHINFVPSALSNAAVRKPYLEAQDVNTAIHEVSHALGFSSQFFGQYVDMNDVRFNSGGTQTSNDATLGKSVTRFVSPRVVAAAKAYFGCSTMTGVEIEDQGGAGTQGSHWEKRILYTEFIAGILSSVKTYVSSLTLAYFEDLGFYTANYGWAQDSQMVFGKGRGCDFVTKKCNDAAVSGLGEYCFDTNKKHMYCSPDFLGQGLCGVGEYGSSLSSHFQYFANPNQGASVSLADFCPTGVPYSNLVCIDGSASDVQNIYGNTYGSGSRCFQSSVISNGYSAGDASTEARCFPVRCSATGRIQIDVQGSTALCPLDGSAGNADMSGVGGFTGVIKCPRSTAFCIDPSVPTPAPTPAPPTPIPTPAPPGQTPGPAPFTRRPTSPPTALPTNCADRTACADAITTRLPWCRSFADAVVECFGRTCDGAMATWLSSKSAACTESYAWGNEFCVEGPSGGAAMCGLLNKS